MSRSIETPTDWRSNANKRRTRALIETTWSQIISLYDDKSVAIHMVNILRSKGNIVGFKEEKHIVKDAKQVTIKVPIYKDPYFMSDEETLKTMEAYREELDLEALDSVNVQE